MKILIWFIIALAVVVWLKRALAGGARPAGQGATGRGQHSEAMVQCAHCGVHFPASEAVAGTGGALYCSADHRTIAQR